jgi:hypothetical protein
MTIFWIKIDQPSKDTKFVPESHTCLSLIKKKIRINLQFNYTILNF